MVPGPRSIRGVCTHSMGRSSFETCPIRHSPSHNPTIFGRYGGRFVPRRTDMRVPNGRSYLFPRCISPRDIIACSPRQGWILAMNNRVESNTGLQNPYTLCPIRANRVRTTFRVGFVCRHCDPLEHSRRQSTIAIPSPPRSDRYDRVCGRHCHNVS